MVAPLVALAKAYAVNKAKDFATSKAEEALGLPKDSIGLATNPVGFAKNIAKDVVRDYAKDSFLGRNEIPEEDRSFSSSSDNGGYDKVALNTYADDDINAFKRGGKVKSATKSKARAASRRGDGIAQRGKTRGRYL
jgi:hypothetical protein|tara:strand:- start:853 stop:1260 length:408 start_codon:yes stop_codon:yes gene_type:complete